MLDRVLRFLFFNILVRTVVLVVLGLNVRHRKRLPKDGPAILAANHNSHLDTMVLMTLLGSKLLPRVRPVAAADYFLRGKLMAWFATRIVGILPLSRHGARRGEDPFAACHAALQRGDILILFPEGSRGEPEQLTRFKTGIARLAEAHPEVPVIPVLLHGLGKALPKGEALLVPFFCDVYVGEPLPLWTGERAAYMKSMEQAFQVLSEEGRFSPWE